MNTTVEIPVCSICGSPLRVTLTHSKKGNVAVGLHCPTDGRHLRAFCNHRPFVEEVVARAEAVAEGGVTASPAGHALQNPQEAPKRARSARRWA